MRRFWLRLHGLAFVALLLVVLGMGAWLSARNNHVWHWGGSLGRELSPPSRQLLARMDGEVAALAFVTPGNLVHRHVQELLAQYARHKADFRIELVNPETRPDLVRALGVRQVGELVLQYGERREHVRVPTEAHVSAALERLLRGQGQFVAFVTGHGERNLLGQANHDLGAFGRALSEKGYRLQPLNLIRDPIPDNTALLVLTPPQVDLLPGERAALSRYLGRGGNLLWLADPGEHARLAPLAQSLGIEWQNGVVVDPAAAATLAVDDARLVLLDGYPAHPVTARLQAPSLLVQASALTAAPAGWEAMPLLSADSGQYLLTDYRTGMALTPPEKAPPLTLGVGLQRQLGERRQRVVVIGDGDFLANEYLGNGANLPLGLNLVDWLTESEVFLDSYARAAPDQVVTLTETQTLIIALGFLLVLPGGFLGGAAWVWWRRRRG